jgi:hypothetical protein
MILIRKLLISMLFFMQLTCLKAQRWDWVQTIRNGSNEYCWDVAADRQGNIVATGRVKAVSIFGSGTYTVTTQPKGLETDVFVAKYRPNGNLAWVRREGGVQPDWGRAITCDKFGNVFVTGDYCDTATFGSFRIAAAGSNQNRNVFFAKYDSTGTCLWVKTAGNAQGYTKGYGVTTDDLGFSYLAGYETGVVSFDGITIGVANKSMPFVAKFSPTGVCVWAKRISITVQGECNDICIDKEGNLLVAGNYNGVLYVNTSTFTGNSPSWPDVFLIKMDTTGNFLWGTTAIGNYLDIPNAVDVDVTGNIYVGGIFARDLKFDGTTTINSRGAGTTAAEVNASADAFIAKYNKDGVFKWVKTISNVGDLAMDGMKVTPSSKVAVAGYIRGPELYFADSLIKADTTVITFIATFDSEGKMLWNKLQGQKVPPTSVQIASVPRGLCIDHHENYFTGGEYVGNPVNFDSIIVGTNGTSIDGFVSKLFPPVDPTIKVDSIIVCPGKPVSFSAIQAGYPLTYTWDFTGAVPSSSKEQNPKVTYATPGIYQAVLKVSNGHETDTISITILVTPAACPTGMEDQPATVLVTTFPNPASSSVTVRVEGLDTPDGLSLEVYDNVGRKIELAQMIVNTSFFLNVESLPAGGYVLNLLRNGTVIKVEKLVVVK